MTLATASLLLDRAGLCYPDAAPRSLLIARANLARLNGGNPASVDRLLREAAGVRPRNLRETIFDAAERRGEGMDPTEFPAISGRDAADPAIWAATANLHAALGQDGRAATAYDIAAALAPRNAWVVYLRALHALDRKDYTKALDDLGVVIAERPDFAPAYFNRAIARLESGDLAGSLADLTACVERKGAPPRAWLIRARVRRRLGDLAGASADLAQGLLLKPDDPPGYVARGLARLPGDPNGALADFDTALAIDPRYRHALQDKANVLSESLGKPEAAIAVLDDAVRFHPESVEARIGRGVLLARLGRRAEAHRDGVQALKQDDSALTLYQAACIHALTSKGVKEDAREALRFLALSVRKEDRWLDVARTDPDVDPLRRIPEYAPLIRSLEMLIKQNGLR